MGRWPSSINVHTLGSGGDLWASKASWADVFMYAAAKSAGGTRPVPFEGDFNIWLESPGGTPYHKEVCGCLSAGHSVEEDRQPTRDGRKLNSFLLNALLVPWAMRECPYLAPGRPPMALGSGHGPVKLVIPLAVAAKERTTRMAYLHA